ncbi:efflux RND transporter periplasmic adaptor subunit [Shewanella sp. SNU WT4]|nr:efflux RND transporter periplasmic adaptor subunit [Shewanella sp. SNU WT4]
MSAAAANKKPVAVITATVSSQSLEQQLSLIGKLEAYESVWVAPQISGKIDKVHIAENQPVKPGDLLITLEDSHVRATVAEAEAILHDEERKLRDFIKLSSSYAITQSEIDAQHAQVDIASARLDAAKSNANYHYLRAPFAGHTGLIDFSPGKMVTAGAELVSIDNLSRLKLDIAVPEKYLSQLSLGMNIQASSAAWPQQAFIGTVKAINPRINANTLNLTLRVEFNNPAKQLMPGMMMQALLTFAPVTAPVIPVQALEYSGTKRFVYVVNDNQVVSREEVILGHRVGDSVLIESGLNVGDEIVVQGLVNMRDGLSIKALVPEHESVTAASQNAIAGAAQVNGAS